MSRRLLVITPGLAYPPRYGGQLAWYHDLRALHAAGIEVLLVSGRTRHEDVREFESHAHRLCDRFHSFGARQTVVRALHPSRPYCANALVPTPQEGDALRAFLGRDGDAIDAVLLEHPYVYEIFAALKPAVNARADVVLRHHNQERLFYRSMFRDARWTSPRKALYLAEQVRMARYEARVLDRVDHVACVSERDARALAATGKAFWLPIVFQPGDMDPGTATDTAVERDLASRFAGREVVLFASSFIGGANVQVVEWFMREVLPRIRAERPDVVFLFGGGRADEYFSEFPADGAERFANVPSIRPYLARADLNVILSFSAAGVKLKLLQALAHRKRVVATSGGVAGSGLEALLPHADEPDALVTLCVRALAGEIDFQPVWQRYATLYDPRRAMDALLQRISAN